MAVIAREPLLGVEGEMPFWTFLDIGLRWLLEGLWEVLGGSLGSLGGVSGTSWGVFGRLFGLLGCLLGDILGS